ncbi:hypothetical protein NHQ30_007153 [Ciborinia camelliae]|nr:hypothetical protein NHQ30_007153 [Ciborinia camelliae]
MMGLGLRGAGAGVGRGGLERLGRTRTRMRMRIDRALCSTGGLSGRGLLPARNFANANANVRKFSMIQKRTTDVMDARDGDGVHRDGVHGDAGYGDLSAMRTRVPFIEAWREERGKLRREREGEKGEVEEKEKEKEIRGGEG